MWGPLDGLRPSLERHVQLKQQQQMQNHDHRTKLREFSLYDEVFIENYSGRGGRWLPGMVVEVT